MVPPYCIPTASSPETHLLPVTSGHIQHLSHCSHAAEAPCAAAVCSRAVKFKLSKVPGSDDLLKGLHRLLFNRDGTVSGTTIYLF
jgi:hypothetical protein